MFITPEDGGRIARELKATIGRDVNIMDRAGVIIASTDPRRVGQPHAVAQRLIRERLPVLEVERTDAAAGVQEGVNLPIHVDGVLEGVIGITGPADAVRDFGNIAKKMTEILLTSLRQQEQQALLASARNLFIEEWLFAGDLDWTAFALRGNLLGIDIEQPRRVAILEYGDDRPDPTAGSAIELRSSRFFRMLEPRLRGDPQTLWTVVNRRILILFSGASMDRAQALLGELRLEEAGRCGARLSGGLSSPSRGAADLRRCYTEAKLAARTAARDGTIRAYSSASLDFVLQNVDPKVKRDVLRAVFPPLPDAERGELLECLRLYFDCDGNVELAAARACVHKNTFRYRMQKALRATGYDLRRPRDAVMLYIALQFLEEAEAG